MMKYKDLDIEAKRNAIENYCHIMRIDLLRYEEKVVNFLLKYEINTLDEKGRFIYAEENNLKP